MTLDFLHQIIMAEFYTDIGSLNNNYKILIIICNVKHKEFNK